MNEGNDMNPALLDNKNLIRNSDAYLARGGKTDPDNDLQWIDDSYKQGQQKFQLSYQFLGSIPNFLQVLGEDLFLLILSYCNAKDFINLCYVSEYYRRCVLTKFDKCYNVSTGFCPVELWTTKMQSNLWV